MMARNEPEGADLGVLERGRDEVTLRFIRRLPHPATKVWRALTESAHLAAWFPTTVEGDLTPGATLRYNFREMNLPGFDGTVLACDPPRLLEFNWGDERLRFELMPDGQDTVLSFSASFAEIGRAARDAAGWHTCLDVLAYDLAASRHPGRRTTGGDTCTGTMCARLARRPPPSGRPWSGKRRTGRLARSRAANRRLTP
jgi:uncharacterized protein YndB with AHSA1/START domain